MKQEMQKKGVLIEILPCEYTTCNAAAGYSDNNYNRASANCNGATNYNGATPNYNRASATTNYNRATTNYNRASGVFHPAANGARCESMLQVEAFAHVWVVDMIDF